MQLNVSHQSQRQSADCLAACAAMGLASLGKKVRYRRLLQALRTMPHGMPFYNIEHLNQLGVAVKTDHGSLGELASHIDQGIPLIVHVRTGELLHWQEDSDHALVVIGYDEQHVIVNDPFLQLGGTRLTHVEFELAWLDGDYQYATIEV